MKKLDFRGALGPPWGGGGFKARVQGRHCPPARQRGEILVFGEKVIRKSLFCCFQGHGRHCERKPAHEYDDDRAVACVGQEGLGEQPVSK